MLQVRAFTFFPHILHKTSSVTCRILSSLFSPQEFIISVRRSLQCSVAMSTRSVSRRSESDDSHNVRIPQAEVGNTDSEIQPQLPIPCHICQRTYTRSDHLARHLRTRESILILRCVSSMSQCSLQYLAIIWLASWIRIS